MFYNVLLLAEKGKTPLEQMNTQQRQLVIGSLAIIVLLGIIMILLVSLSARMMRRYVQQSSVRSPRTSPLAQGDDWAKKRLIDIDDPVDES